MHIVSALVLLFGLGSPMLAAPAPEYEHVIYIAGLGLDSCAKFMAHENRQGLYIQWFLGYIVGTQVALGTDTTLATDGEGMVGWLKKYATDHPDHNLFRAAQMFCVEHGLVEKPKNKRKR